MAPITRSHTRYAHGEFCKYVMEQPTVMELIVKNIETPREIAVLKAVFKSERCTDALNKVTNMNNAKHVVRRNYFVKLIQRRVDENSQMAYDYVFCCAMMDMFKEILEFEDILINNKINNHTINNKCFVSFVNNVIDKVDYVKRLFHSLAENDNGFSLRIDSYKAKFEAIKLALE
jgi:hypothetical protein